MKKAKLNDLVVLNDLDDAQIFTVKSVTGSDIEVSYRLKTGEWVKPAMVHVSTLQLANRKQLAHFHHQELTPHGGFRKGAGRPSIDEPAKLRSIKLIDRHWLTLRRLGMPWLRTTLDENETSD